MAPVAGDGLVFLDERETRDRVVEYRLHGLESVFRVTGGTVLGKGALMRIGMTAGARGRLRLDLRRRAQVASRACHRRVPAPQRKRGAVVIQGLCSPGCRRMT